jgi:hypothetical protein
MKCKAVDPTRTTALESLDFGSVYTPDGREHSVTALTLPFLANLTNPQMSQPSSSNPVDPPSTYPATGPNLSQPQLNLNAATASSPQTGISAGPFSLTLPQNFGARIAVAVVAILVIAVLVWKIVK